MEVIMLSRFYLVLLFSFIIFCLNLSAEELRRFNDINMQPEVWHFNGVVEGKVDAKGDLNLSIPVLTVPGTHGLDFDINFSYKAGIRYHQKASWIGLGWNFDPGSITRDVVGDVRVNGTLFGIDYDSDPGSYSYMPDHYFLALPGKGTHKFMRTNYADFNIFEGNPFYKHPRNSKFVLEEYKPYKIEDYRHDNYNWPGSINLPSGKKDITEFVITDDNGYKYYYGLPSLAKFKLFEGYVYDAYPNVWRLLAITGPEFVGNITDYIQNDENSFVYGSSIYDISLLQNKKQWVIFEYKFNETDIFKTVPDNYNIIQNTFLKYIITPTYIAEFITESRNDIDLKQKNMSPIDDHTAFRKLIAIELKTRAGLMVKKVNLTQNYELSKWSNDPALDGRLTLKSVNFESYNGQSLPGYDFEYINNNGFNPYWSDKADEWYYDGLGYYNSNDRPRTGIDAGSAVDAKAWSLTKITYPTGGWEIYEYENDKIDDDPISYRAISSSGPDNEEIIKVFDFDTFIPGGCRRQGGVRVTKIIKGDGQQQEEINYLYGPGHVASITALLLV
jgi:hypothetical protein